MELEIFIVKGKYDDLEIQTNNTEKKLYVAKGWLVNMSPYFNAMLKSGLKESDSNTIILSREYDIILMIFRCIHSLYRFGEEYIGANLLNKLDKIDDICELLFTVQEYQLNVLKLICDRYFASHPDKISFFSEELIKTICLLDLERMRKTYQRIITKNENIYKLSYETMTSDVFKFCCSGSWRSRLEIFRLWIQRSNPDPIDDKLREFGLFTYNYREVPKDCSKTLMYILHRLKSANTFRFMIYKYFPCTMRL